MRFTLRPPETLALKAVLADQADAFKAWNEFKAAYELADLGPDSSALLPLLFFKLKALEVSDLSLGKMKGFYRRNWFKNQLLLEKMTTLVQALAAAGVETMLTNKAALALRYYQDLGIRSIDHFFFAVRAQQVETAQSVLKQYGMGQLQADAHRRLLYLSGAIVECGTPRSDASFWQDAQHLDISGQPVRVLNANDQLLHTLLSTKYPLFSPALWVVDVATILADNELSADQILERVHEYRMAGSIKSAVAQLLWLYPELSAKPLLTALQEIMISKTEWAEQKAFAIKGVGPLFYRVQRRLHRYHRQ